jgi:hypothetical protein
MPTEPDNDVRATRNLAMGRIFSLLSRPFREGDVEEYERARSAFLATCGDVVGGYTLPHAASSLMRHKAIYGD